MSFCLRGGKIIKVPEVFMQKNTVNNKVIIRIDRNDEFCYKSSFTESVVKEYYYKLFKGDSVKKSELQDLKQKIEKFLTMCVSEGLIVKKSDLETAPKKRIPGGPSFNTNSFVAI